MDPIKSLPEVLQNEALEKWESFKGGAIAAGIQYPQDPATVGTLIRVFAVSDFVSGNCIRSPELWSDLVTSGDLDRSYEKGRYVGILRQDLAGIQDIPELEKRLRSRRRREMTRIAWRDLAGSADLAETMGDLSVFADACLAETLELLHNRLVDTHGTPVDSKGKPQHLVIIAMGKLGAEELNFSSDVDLILAYPETGETEGSSHPVSNEEFFTRLGRSLVRTIGSSTSDGIVFRVDLRLRPMGENGPLVMDFDNMEEYYQRQGREWERYAWIKARVTAGDIDAGKQLLATLRPFVFRRYLDYSTFDALREMKELISVEVRQQKLEDNIKLGSGGIREIEFFGQAFQLIRGGVLPQLQSRRILDTLQVLSGNGYISEETRLELGEAYAFLRITEHRLQELSDRQTHLLPGSSADRARLALSTGFDTWESFASRLQAHRSNVTRHFSSLLADPEDPSDENVQSKVDNTWLNPDHADTNRSVLSSLGFNGPDRIMELLKSLEGDPSTRSLSSEGRKRLDKLMPMILKATAGLADPVPVLGRILSLIRTIQRRTTYLSLLLENPAALAHLTSLAEASPWVVSFLSSHPVLLDELLDPRTLYTPPEKDEMQKEIAESLGKAPDDDLEHQIEQLCIFKQINMLRISAADVTGSLPVMRASDHLTELAETVVDQVLKLSWDHLVSRHGMPDMGEYAANGNRGFAVIAYGKLGGIELGYASDLDLVFIYTGKKGKTGSDIRPIDNALFYSRLGQRVIHTLAAHTRAGRLYETDVRLRPSGESGVLVSPVDGFRSYQMNDAWTWEHQALIRARVISGDDYLKAEFDTIRETVLARPREGRQLRKDVRDMRERMRKEATATESGFFNLKQDTGGIVDIEFIVQYLVLQESCRHPSLTRWTDNVRLIESLNDAGIIDGETAHMLRIAYLAYRSAAHRLSLQEKPSTTPSDEFGEYREKIIRIWERYLGSKEPAA